MQRGNKFTVVSLLGPNQMGRTITGPRRARRFHRRQGKLSDRLLAAAVVWPVESKANLRPDLQFTTL